MTSTVEIAPVEPKVFEKVFSCPICGENFPTEEDLKKHVEKEHAVVGIMKTQPGPERTPPTVVLDLAPSRGLYLVSPHGKMVAEGDKTIIVKSKKFNIGNEPLYLLEDKLCWGIVTLSPPEEVNYEKFEKERDKHKVTDEEAFKRWGWNRTEPLYFYYVKSMDKYESPKAVKIPKGIQTFVDAKNIQFLTSFDFTPADLEIYHAYAHGRNLGSLHEFLLETFKGRNIPHFPVDDLDDYHELLIRDWKTYDPQKLMETEANRKILADDHRIVHTWWKYLQKGKPMKSPQFKEESIIEQKEIVKKLHNDIVNCFEKLKWEHDSPLSEEELDISKITQADMENVDDQFIKNLSDKDLMRLHDKIHEVYRQIGKVTEPVQNAHVFVWSAMRKRGLDHGPLVDALDEKSVLDVVEYPKPEGLKENEIITLKEVLDAFPDKAILSEDPPHVHLVGRIVNEGFIPKDHDIDLLFKQRFPDARIIYEFLTAVRTRNPEIAKRIHFVWDPWGPQIGFSIPLYRISYNKLGQGELIKHHPFEYLSKEETVKLFHPVKSLKCSTGFNKNEFFEPQMLWDNWAASNIEKGIVIQKKYDGMRFQVHRDGDKVACYTEDRMRDRTPIFKESVKELLAKSKVKRFILDCEMVEYDCKGKDVKDKEEICDALPRENMIPWVTAEKKEMNDNGIVFHVHDCLFLDDEGDIHDKGYLERWEKISKILPNGMTHWREVPTIIAKNKVEFERDLEKVRRIRGSEGAMFKLQDSKYPLTGRTSEWAKIKNVKEIDVMVWNVVPKKNSKTGEVIQGQYMYDCVFSIPCDLEKDIVPDKFIKYKGKCYTIIGRTYSSGVKAGRGDIVTIQPIRIAKYTKGDKIFYTWMFPTFKARNPVKKEPDGLDVVKKLIEKGTTPLSDEKVLIHLQGCPFWNDSSICPLKERFWMPRDKLSKIVAKETLKYPIACPHAFHFRCKFVKGYYYGEKVLAKIPEKNDDLSQKKKYKYKEVKNK